FHYIFVVMLTAAVLGIILSVVNSYTSSANAAAGGGGNFTEAALPIVIISLVGALILMQVRTNGERTGSGLASYHMVRS
ncbi:MAG: hypothetical protein JXR43_04940, partial [Burkholderiaceae bacterium]|nr:hypothetical protein [Burkholderiaceae bacterium]